MFKIVVEDVIRVHNGLMSIFGICENSENFISGTLIDEYGNRYEAHKPFVKPLAINETNVVLGITGNYAKEDLLGKTLTNA